MLLPKILKTKNEVINIEEIQVYFSSKKECLPITCRPQITKSLEPSLMDLSKEFFIVFPRLTKSSEINFSLVFSGFTSQIRSSTHFFSLMVLTMKSGLDPIRVLSKLFLAND